MLKQLSNHNILHKNWILNELHFAVVGILIMYFKILQYTQLFATYWLFMNIAKVQLTDDIVVYKSLISGQFVGPRISQ